MQIPKIDILKLDTQGTEVDVIAGAAETCKKKSISIIITEIITQPTYKGQKRFDEILSVFYNAGFDLHSFHEMSHTADGRFRQLDAIFTVNA